MRRVLGACLVAAALLCPGAATAQHEHHAAPPDTTARPAPSASSHPHRGTTSRAHGDGAMHGMYGPYPMSREASGTAWQPESATHGGVHASPGAWMLMLHGFADGVQDVQDGPRGDTKFFASNMVMAMAHRELGPGTVGLRTMLSLEPTTIGQEGYPLLFQTGETADGVTPLIDRQHPHDLFMELAATYSVARGNNSIFLYGGLPGEPALGPPAFMHRFTGMNVPVAPIAHHWLDATHITYGVLTGGLVLDRIKVEASAFRGREPDQDRWDIETPELDSHSFRVSVNPTNEWSMQVSYGRLHGPEQLEPEVNQDRTTVSFIYERSWEGGRWGGALMWGQNRNRPGPILDSFLAEAALRSGDRHTVFARIERVEKNELFAEPDERAHEVFDVGELTAGYRYDVLRRDPWSLGIGAAGTWSQVPTELRDDYGDNPVSGLFFVRVALE